MTPQEFDERYPAYCRTCQGFGLVGDVGYSPEDGFPEPCPDCIEKGRCPRCGVIGLQLRLDGDGDVMADCLRCGWTEADPCGRPESENAADLEALFNEKR